MEQELFNYLKDNIRLQEDRDYAGRYVVLQIKRPNEERKLIPSIFNTNGVMDDGWETISSVTIENYNID